MLAAQEAAPGACRNPMQVGAELYGHGGPESDVEVLRLLLATLRTAGHDSVHVDLGHVGIFRGLSRAAGLNSDAEHTLFELLQRCVRVDGFGSCLNDEQLAGLAVLGPLDVHRRRRAAGQAVVPLDRAAPARQRQDLVVAERQPRAVARRHRDELHATAPALVVDQLEFLAADRPADNRPQILLEWRLEDAVLVWRHGSLHDRLAKTVRRVDQHHVWKAALRIEREHDA